MAIRKFNYPTITPGDYNERTGQWENGSPYDSDLGWNNDERSGAYTRIDPNYQIPSSFNLNDLKNKSGFALNPSGEIVSYSADETLDPSNYYNELGTALVDSASQAWATNSDFSNYNNLIEGLKEVDPKAYYTTKIDFLSRQAGHQNVMNDMGRLEDVNSQIQKLLPEAQKAGVTPEQINSTYQSGFTSGAKYGQQVLGAQQGSGGGFFKPFIEGLKVVAPAALGMYGLDMALGAGLGAASAAGAVDSTAVALGGAGGGGAFVPSAGASFALAPGAAYTTSGLVGLGENALSTADILGSTGFLPTDVGNFAIDPTATYTTANVASPSSIAEILNSTGFEASPNADFTVDPTATYTTNATPPISTDIGMGTNAPLQGPTYQELGVTGVPEGGMGPTYGEMGYTGLNTEEAIAAADAASKGMSASEILSNANKAKNLAKLLDSGNTATKAATKTTGTTGINAQQLASLLGSTLPTQAAPGNIYRMNQNPFTFGTQGQTPVSQGMYDVSGTNPMANALRKA